MAISFNGIPSNLRVPFVAVEFDNSRSAQGPGLLPYRALIIGQKIAAGTALANTTVRVTSANQAATLAGRGSMLHRMAVKWFANNKSTEVFLGVLEDNAAGVAAVKTLTFTGTATAPGTLSLYIAGDLVQVAVASGDTATIAAASAAAAVNASLDLPVTASAALGVLTLTARNKGAVSQDIDVRLNYQDTEATPTGLAAVIANGAAGATNPLLTTLIAALGDTWYQVIAQPFTDATSLTALETELASRFGPLRMIDGVAFTGAKGTVSTLGTLGDSRNSPHISILSQAGRNPLTSPSEYATAVAASVAFSANIDPARPFQTLPVVGVRSPVEADLFTLQERNLLLFDGISTSRVAAGGVVQIERLVTTYQTAPSGAADTSYYDVTTMLTLLYLRFSFRNLILAKYPRHKLASDGAKFGPGQAVLTPRIGKAEAVNWFRQMEELGLVENFDQFKADLVVERNTLDPNRLDFLLPPDLINSFIVGAVNTQFRL